MLGNTLRRLSDDKATTLFAADLLLKDFQILRCTTATAPKALDGRSLLAAIIS